MSKYKIAVLIIFISFVFFANFVKGNNLELLGKIIYIDPGHGGVDPGAMYKNIKESEINLEIGLKLKKKLTELGAIVYITRDSDVDLALKNSYSRKRSDLNNRITAINNSDCDIYISLHLNSDISSTWYGSQIFYDDINSENEKIAKLFQKQIEKELNSKRRYKKVNDLYLLKNITKPGILFEMGFISNSSDRYLLQQDEYQDKIVDTISKGIIEYFIN